MFAFLLVALVSAANYGIDVSQPTSTSSFTCLRNNGFTTMVIVRAWKSTGSFDSNCVQTLKNANAAGFTIKNSDAYFYPCISCGDAAGQVSTFWSKVISNKLQIERVWFDIEGTWTSSVTSNRNFFEAMVNKAINMNIKYGIYASKNYWSSIMGSYTFSHASSVPLWYPHYDNSASFSDFSAFGGWSSPSMKQYRGDVSTCSAGVDYNYKP
ncbi:lysozyme, putative [Entamoeba invadens IP1]|uniref:lysozyme n=1 Tax=Entamoeba invadens IP1 TaxID=370355 RepID=A0A0A1UDN7_ENTIV|nr:lysozyme, putative [Entamoeba invadens IP1]ELP94720.1 lysozyme, putative [Entamoeba invadens IP1]|eukprot:XP_004261491.1 lysozyme, putative [Entamoeba invadens IP1]